MIELGIYEHYKGNRYKVLFCGIYEPTEEPVVIYETLYDNDVSNIWVRPEKVFTEMVEVNGELVPRFKKVE